MSLCLTRFKLTNQLLVGQGSTGNFTEFDYALNLYSPNSFSDPTNFSDAKAFRYQWNDAYSFARIEAEDYAGGNISPLWEVGDLDFEITGARWQVSNGGYARFISPGSPAYFEVTTSQAEFNVDTSFSGGISVSMDGNRVEDVGTPTLGNDAATKDYVDSKTTDLKNARITLGSGQVQSLNGGGTLQLIAAPTGTDKIIAVMNVIFQVAFQSVPYNFAASGISDSINFYIGTDQSRNISNSIWNSASDKYVSYDFPNSDVNTDIQPNVAFTIQASAGMTVTQGDSDIEIYILYREVELA